MKKKFLPYDVINLSCKFKRADGSIYETIIINGFFKRTPNSSKKKWNHLLFFNINIYFLFKAESIGHFNTIARLDSFLKLREIYPSNNFKKEFLSEYSLDLKFKNLDLK